ncbi:hypothetical protein OS493_007578 [Desmophyllum pertusum]|uniref:SRCR domain-containing protein n=1 Tax=Desmophyllum pertusum TaxID=174260 RepID=A0A9X0CT23_9CNID|nr:hypothetical protein OS493_007578 [Desmophyllum pertusum]
MLVWLRYSTMEPGVRYVVAGTNGIYSPQTLWSCVGSLDSVQLSDHTSGALHFSNCPSRDHATGAIWLSDVRCRGNESSLDQCPSSGWGIAEIYCTGHTFDACLVCYDPLYHNSEIAVQLSGSEVPYAGRVKVRYQGVWGTLCGYDWKHETAEVLCRHLGYKGV